MPPSDPSRQHIVDLTMPISDGMDAFPGEPTARFTRFSSVDDATGIEMWNVEMFSQLGTHLDAPCHFVPGGAAVDQLDLARCVGPATVVDHPASAGPVIDSRHLQPYEESLRRTRRALVRTGWDAHVGSERYWSGVPEITTAAARYLVEIGVVFLGLDTPTPSFSDLHDVHRTLLGANVVITECLVNLGRLSAETWLICLPLPLVGLDGSPVRAIALERAVDVTA
jgi:arylformamidase